MDPIEKSVIEQLQSINKKLTKELKYIKELNKALTKENEELIYELEHGDDEIEIEIELDPVEIKPEEV